MKKTLLIVLALVTLLVLCVGCAKKAEEKLLEEIGEGLEDMAEDLEDAAEDIADAAENLGDGQEDIVDTEDEVSDDVSQEATPCASYERFMEVKGQSYETLMENMDESADFYMGATFELLAVTMIDLQTIDLAFVTGEEAATETAAGIMGIEDMNLQYSGEDFSLSYTGASGEAYVSSGKYDPATDSLTCTWTKDGAETLMLEYVKYGAGYAAQYFITDETGTSIIKIIVDGENTVIGIGETGAKPASIYKEAPADLSFADDCASVFKLVDGKGTYKCADGDYEL